MAASCSMSCDTGSGTTSGAWLNMSMRTVGMSITRAAVAVGVAAMAALGMLS
jgi:hypothetical protein